MRKVFVQTYGCSLNASDSEAMKGVLLEHGFLLAQSEEEADILVINSCTVKSNPEQRLFFQLRHKSKPVVVAGCVPAADPTNKHFEGVSVIGPKALSQIAFVVEETLAGKVVQILEDVDTDRNALPFLPQEDHIAIIPINAGCLSHCTYCKTKAARGHLQSYSPEAIEKQFRDAVNKGAQEVWLTSQDTGAYGLDIGTDVVALLERLLQKEGDYRIRLGMANPQYIIPRLAGMIRVLSHPRMFRFLHLPVQSGSDKVLRDMKRGYKVAAFCTVVESVRKAIPDVTIATDIIVGFPTENEEDFEETVALLRKTRIPVVNLSKFYPRPGTPAAAMKLLQTDIVKERSTKLKKICEEIAAERNASFVGKKLSVLVDEKGKKQGTMIARADNYLQVIVKSGELGERKSVLIGSSGTFDARE